MKKIFLGINITNGVDGVRFDSDVFAVQHITSELQQKIDDSEEAIEALKNEVVLPAVIRGIGMVALAAVPICAKVIQRMIKNQTWEEFMQTTPWMFYILVASGIIGIVILAAAYIKPRVKVQEIEAQRAIEHYNQVRDESNDMLGVPSGADYVDIFACSYLIINGEPVVQKVDGITFYNVACWAFRQDNTMFVADVSMKLAVPLECITAIRKVKQRTVISKWNKEEKPNKGEYKEYRISMNDKEQPILKYYYALCFTHNGDEFELYFPPYELPVFERLTGKRALQ